MIKINPSSFKLSSIKYILPQSTLGQKCIQQRNIYSNFKSLILDTSTPNSKNISQQINIPKQYTQTSFNNIISNGNNITSNLKFYSKDRNSDSIEAIARELTDYNKIAQNKKDWPINNEVLLCPLPIAHLVGSRGPIYLSSEITDKLIPNSSGRLHIGFFLLKEGFRHMSASQIPSIDAVHRVGVLADIIDIGLGVYWFDTISIIKIKQMVKGGSPFTVQIEPFKMKDAKAQSEVSGDQIQKDDYVNQKETEIRKKILDLIDQYQKLYPGAYTHNKKDDFYQKFVNLSTEVFIGAVVYLYGLHDPEQSQAILEDDTYIGKLERVYQLLLKEQDSLSRQQLIYIDLQDKKSPNHRKTLLTEQLNKIKSQLGLENDEKEQVVKKYQNKLDKLLIDDNKRKVIQDEINKLSTIDPVSMESGSIRNYLDWLTNLPWNVYSPEYFDLAHSKEVLDKDHYGLEDIKQRILEFIAVGHLKGSVQGKIICFVGPPGTGKTTIGKSIGKCLKREFYRFSVGGLFDEGEIKGHRRTYVGSMPGKLIQSMKQVKTSNPVILIDEIDKIGKRNLGDPSSALLEVLDPEQNSQFVDHYLDVPYDLSKVLFICTANSLDTIPGPLLDRMEIINLSGYIESEQIQIVKNFIIPKKLVENGIKEDQLTITDDVIKTLVKSYSREVGIRELERLIEKIMRKCALKLAKGESQHITIDTNNLKDNYLGVEAYSSDRYYDVTPTGVVNGLAYTPRGGSTLYIETTANPKSTPKLHTTGKLGEVMTESTSIAYTYAKNFLSIIDPNNKFFENNALHMHVPQGGISKDGPSAGVTMVTSLLSLALDEPVLNDLGMTGELSITGKVMAIGGIKEKSIAAKRSGLKTIVIPESNKYDFQDLPTHIKDNIDCKYALEYKDVFKVAFPNKIHLLSNLQQQEQNENLNDNKKEIPISISI